MNNKYYVTTPIYYVNDIPHIGHAYTTVAADVTARFWKEKLGCENVFFLVGTDEHGVKVAKSAKEAGKEPQEFVDSIAPQFEQTWKSLNISYSHFFRTTDRKHEKIVQEILQKIYDAGYIYENIYEGLYCEGCERFLTEEELVNGNCPLHPNKKPVFQKEKNYFFKLSSFKDELIKIFENDEVKILPETRKNEILGKIRKELKDVSISRQGVSWGIPIPWDNKQTIYVWVDALLNYYTATRFLENKESFWPPDLHIVGRDILWFHTVIWCTLLKAANISLPKKIFAHGFFTINGQKMSKSLGNVISPKELVDKFGIDATRYLLLSEFPFGQDGDFSFEKIKIKYNSDLANGLGNLIARVAKLCEKSEFKFNYDKGDTYKKSEILEKHIEELKFEAALSNTWNKISFVDKIINQEKPWEIKDNKILNEKLYIYVKNIIEIATDLKPFMPETAEKIEKQFTKQNINSQEPLFPRL